MPGSAVRLALVEVAAQADVPVGEREHRLGLGEHAAGRGRSRAPPTARPGRRSGGCDRRWAATVTGGHAPPPPSSSARSPTTTSAPCSRSASACPTRLTPTTNPKPPARPACDAGQRVLEDRRLRRAPRRARAAPARNVSGLGLPGRWRSRATTGRRRARRTGRSSPVTCSTSRGVGARRDHRRAQPGLARRRAGSAPTPRTPPRRPRGSGAGRCRSCGCRGRCTVCASGGSSGSPSGRSMPRDRRKSRTPSARGLPST